MQIVLAKQSELDEIKKMYTKIIENMYDNNIKIWNEYYPNEVLESDIMNGSLYLLKDGEIIIGAFAIYEHINVEQDVEWENKEAKAYILNRVGVNVEYLKQGYGKAIIDHACKIAKNKGANYLRLLVCDVNVPAINLYTKCKFKRLLGVHEEKINENFSIYEYGFEKLLI